MQGHYQNLLADHQAGVGTSALSFALSRAFLEVWEGSSGLCGGWRGGCVVSTVGTCGKPSTSRDGAGPFMPLTASSRASPSIHPPGHVIPMSRSRLLEQQSVSSHGHTGRPDVGAEEGTLRSKQEWLRRRRAHSLRAPASPPHSPGLWWSGTDGGLPRPILGRETSLAEARHGTSRLPAQPVDAGGPAANPSPPRSSVPARSPFTIFQGGMPRASYGDRHCISVIHNGQQTAFDFTSRVIDFAVLTEPDPAAGRRASGGARKLSPWEVWGCRPVCERRGGACMGLPKPATP